jgi:hypothetical protein
MKNENHLPTGSGTKRVAVILDRDLYNRLMISAKEDNRSGRQQLAHILTQYFGGNDVKHRK